MSAYISAKMGAWGLIKAMAVELGPKGIRCNAVSPGMINTPYTKDMPLRLKQVEAASNPLRRLCRVEDVAQVVGFLCGPGASFINGVNIPVTGGARMP
jgi:NAD(P)-dependent dehydrogenase (short-subunit alcohol dehydrogenase family)